jgi:hypothetical protein
MPVNWLTANRLAPKAASSHNVSESATYSLIGLLRVWMSRPSGRTVLIESDTVSILISQMNQLDLLLPRLRPKLEL